MQLRRPDPPLSWAGARLRAWRGDDAHRLVAAWTDPEIARWNPVPADPTVERARAWIAGCEARMNANRALDLCIVTDDHVAGAQPGEGTVVGEIGLSGIDVEHRGAFVGYWLLPEARGRGLSSSALRHLSAWALGEVGFRVLVARCATANLASHHVARAAGFAHRRADHAGHQLYVRKHETPI